MPIFLTFLSACMAPPVEDPHPSPIQPTKPKPTSQHSSGEKDIFISRINLGPGKEDLTDEMKEYLLANDYYSSTQCLQTPLANDDNKITPNEAMKYTRVEDGVPLQIGGGPPLLADDFYTEFPGYYLDFTKGNIGTYDSKEQSEEEAFSAIERGMATLLAQDKSRELQDQFIDGFIDLRESGMDVDAGNINQMAFTFRDCQQKLGGSGNTLMTWDPPEKMKEDFTKILTTQPSPPVDLPTAWQMMFNWAKVQQKSKDFFDSSEDQNLFSSIFFAQSTSNSETWEALQDYCNHPEDIDDIMSEYFPDQ